LNLLKLSKQSKRRLLHPQAQHQHHRHLQRKKKVEEKNTAPENKPPEQPTETKTPEQTPPQETKPTEQPKEEEKKKKKVRYVKLAVNEFTTSLSQKEIEVLTEEEGKMIAADRLSAETSEKKNAVGSYIYDMRAKIGEGLGQFAPEEPKQTFEKLLEETATWLYNEGFDVTKSVYSKKLEDLHSLGDPFVRRKFEFENRYESLMALRTTMEQFKLLANSVEPKYDHIEKEERNKVLEQVSTAEKWVEELMAKQEKLLKYQDPVITCAQISGKKKLNWKDFAAQF